MAIFRCDTLPLRGGDFPPGQGPILQWLKREGEDLKDKKFYSRDGKGKDKDGSQIADEGASSSEEEEEEEEESAPDMKVHDAIHDDATGVFDDDGSEYEVR